jgi:AcrR family transcriptional regulator
MTGVVKLVGVRDDRIVTVRGWAGTTLAARRADRRRRLLDACLELLGTEGSAAVSVRSICRTAELTDRYFYENFADREALLIAVYDEVAYEAGQVLIDAVAGASSDDDEVVVRAAVDAFLDLITGDPRKGRVLLLEPLADQALAAHSVQLSPAFASIIRAQLDDMDDTDAQLAATAIVGAMANLCIRWWDGSLAIDRETLANFCVRLLVASMALAGPAKTPAGAARRRVDRRR